MGVRIIHNAALVPFGGSPAIEGGAVAWDNGKIIAVGSSRLIVDRYGGTDSFALDAGGRMVTPGLVNLHSHLYSTLARGLSSAGPPPTNFPEILKSYWWRWDKCLDLEAVGLSARMGLVESLKCGVTTLFDHHSSPNAVKGSLAAIAQNYEQLGLRGSLCYEASDRDGQRIAAKAIEENLAFADSVPGNSESRLTAHFGLHANFTLSDDTLREVSQRLHNTNAGIHIHLAEDDSDNQAALSAGYPGPVDRLEHFGLLDDKSLLIHGIHLLKDQWDTVVNRTCHVIHNPASNLNNAVGIATIGEMLEHGLSVGLGTDGYSSNMLTSVDMARLTAKAKSGDPRQGEWAVTLLTEANPRIASQLLGRKIGTLEKDAAADIVLWDYAPMTSLDDETFAAHLIFGLQHAKPRQAWIDGNKVLQDGRPIAVAEDRLVTEARAMATILWERFRKIDIRQ